MRYYTQMNDPGRINSPEFVMIASDGGNQYSVLNPASPPALTLQYPCNSLYNELYARDGHAVPQGLVTG